MPPKARQPRYQLIETRIASFTNPAPGGKGGLGASTSRRGAKAKTWPHPLNATFNPESLARAGFYFNPSDRDPDNCTCFLCGKSLGGWVRGDIPYKEHVSHDEVECGWARAVCQVKCQDRVDRHGSTFIFDTADRLPTSEELVAARHHTFSEWWPHDKSRKHLATSDKLARAGFHYTPDSKADDLVTCVYCGTELDGWEPSDDPLEEHRRKQPGCVFFTAGNRVGVPVSMHDETVADVPQSRANGTSKKVTKSSSSRALSAQPSKSQSTRSLRGGTDSEAEPTTSKKAQTTLPRSHSTAPNDVEVSASEGEPDVIEEEQPPPKLPKGKGKSAKTTTSQQSTSSTADPAAPATEPPKKKRGRPPKKKPAVEPEPDPVPEPEIDAVVDSADEPEQANQEDNGEPIIASAEFAPEPEPEPEPEPAQPKKRGRQKKAKPEPEPVVLSDDDVATAKPPPRPARGKAKAAAPASQPSTSESQTEQPRVTRSTSKQTLASETDDVTGESESEDKPPKSAQAASTVQPKAPNLRKSTRNKGTAGAASESEMDTVPESDQPEPSDKGEDDDIDVEEVERTIMEQPPPALPVAAAPPAPATPTRGLPVRAPVLPGPSLPIPAMQPALPLPPISSFTEAELSMTLEEWVRHETRRQYEVLRAEGERRIAEFVEKARIIRSRIEAL